jgi:hypothetical protein
VLASSNITAAATANFFTQIAVLIFNFRPVYAYMPCTHLHMCVYTLQILTNKLLLMAADYRNNYWLDLVVDDAVQELMAGSCCHCCDCGDHCRLSVCVFVVFLNAKL